MACTEPQIQTQMLAYLAKIFNPYICFKSFNDTMEQSTLFEKSITVVYDITKQSHCKYILSAILDYPNIDLLPCYIDTREDNNINTMNADLFAFFYHLGEIMAASYGVTSVATIMEHIRYTYDGDINYIYDVASACAQFAMGLIVRSEKFSKFLCDLCRSKQCINFCTPDTHLIEFFQKIYETQLKTDKSKNAFII